MMLVRRMIQRKRDPFHLVFPSFLANLSLLTFSSPTSPFSRPTWAPFLSPSPPLAIPHSCSRARRYPSKSCVRALCSLYLSPTYPLEPLAFSFTCPFRSQPTLHPCSLSSTPAPLYICHCYSTSLSCILFFCDTHLYPQHRFTSLHLTSPPHPTRPSLHSVADHTYTHMNEISSPTETTFSKAEYFDDKDSNNDPESSVDMSEEYEGQNSSVEAVRLGMHYVFVTRKLLSRERKKRSAKVCC